MTLLTAASDEPVDFLRHKSGVHKQQMRAPKISDILIVDDSQSDTKALAAMLRSAFGRDCSIRTASSLMRACNMLLERLPDLVILDDILPPRDRADSSIPALRKGGFAGPIVVVSGGLTRLRRLELQRIGAASVIHKDDLNIAALAEAVVPAEHRPASASDGGRATSDPEEDLGSDDPHSTET